MKSNGDNSESVSGQLGIPAADPNPDRPTGTGKEDLNGTRRETPDQAPPVVAAEDTWTPPTSDFIKRKGFFEAINSIECPKKQLASWVDETRKEAERDQLNIREQTEIRIEFLEKMIEDERRAIEELRKKIEQDQQYREIDDEDLDRLIKEKEKLEAELAVLQNELVEVRINLGKAKANIVVNSLNAANDLITTALTIQGNIYDEVNKLNQKKFADDKDRLALLKRSLEGLYGEYGARYANIKKHLAILDADGISPLTTRILTTIGSVGFGVAGFFFSVFAGNENFGKEDFLSVIIRGLTSTANQPATLYFKVGVLVGLILVISLVSWFCNFLMDYLRRKSDERERDKIVNDIRIEGKVGDRYKHGFEAEIKSNNWLSVWLQFVPGILIAGLLLLGISGVASERLDSLSASSEGLIVGTGLAMSLAGIIYLYIIKVVEPRLLRRYQGNLNQPVNWSWANRELAFTLIVFMAFAVFIIVIPIVDTSRLTQYAILLFLSASLAGGTSFAYGVRNAGLIRTSIALESMLLRLSEEIASCSGPTIQAMNITVTKEHGNILQQVMEQLANRTEVRGKRKAEQGEKENELTGIERALSQIFPRKRQYEPAPTDPFTNTTAIDSWESNHFPDLVDELRAKEFEFREKKAKIQKAEDMISDHKVATQVKFRQRKTDVETCKKNVMKYADEMREAQNQREERCRKSRDRYTVMVNDFLDGFHLGMLYRESNMGPEYFEKCKPGPPVNLLLPANSL